MPCSLAYTFLPSSQTLEAGLRLVLARCRAFSLLLRSFPASDVCRHRALLLAGPWCVLAVANMQSHLEAFASR